MRIGSNPFKGKRKNPANDVTVAVVTCVPSLEGYFRGKSDVLKICLSSIWKNTDVPYDLMVVDNGSTSEVTRYLVDLKERNLVQYLMLNSLNVGRTGAQNIIFSTAPGKYIAYSDDDCFYYPNWLSKHLEVFRTFPNVGMVSGKYISGDHPVTKTIETIRRNGWKMRDFEVPKEWNREWAIGIGMDPEKFLQTPEVLNCKTYLVERDGVKAFPGSQGYQLVVKKETIKQFLPIENEFLAGAGMSYAFHESVDKAGYLRLTTFNKYSMHIGNIVTTYWREEAKKYGICVDEVGVQNYSTKHKKERPWYLRNRLFYEVLNKIYVKLFDVLHR